MHLLTRSALALLLTTPATSAFAQDSDQDGAQDSNDVYPCDPHASATSFAPSENGHGALLFEDQWPQRGDLDFNDAVVSYHYAFRTNAIGEVVGIRATYNAIAAGGRLRHGLALSLPLPRNTFARATRIVGDAPAELIYATPDSQLTFIVTRDFHELHWNPPTQTINSDPYDTRWQGQAVVVDIELVAPVQLSIGHAPFDLFIFRSHDYAHQIHRPEYPGTDGMNAALFGTGDDGSAEGRYFVDSQGLPFALVLPAISTYPYEGAAIHALFPNIVRFAASGGATDRDFYQSNVVRQYSYADIHWSGAAVAPLFGPAFAIEEGCLVGVRHLDFLTTAEGGISPEYQSSELAVDWDNDRAYFVDSDSDPSQAILRSFRISTMVEDRQARLSSMLAPPGNFPDTLFSDGDGFIYMITGSSNSKPIHKIDAATLREVGRFGSNSSRLDNRVDSVVTPVFMAATRPGSGSGYLVMGSLFDDIAVLDRSNMSYVWGAGETVQESRVRGVVAGDGDEAFILGTNLGTSQFVVALYHLTISGGAVSVTRKEFAPSDIDSSATAFYDGAGGLMYDATDGGVIFQVRMSNNGSPGVIRTIKARAGTIVWNVVTPFMINYDGSFTSQNRLTNNLWTQMRGNRLLQLDTRTGAAVMDQRHVFFEGGSQAYDADANRLIVQTGSGWTRINLPHVPR